MNKIKKKIDILASRYNLQIIYAFGSRAKEALDMVEGKSKQLSSSTSDLDIGIKSESLLTVEEKVRIAIFFEDLFDLPKVDIVVLSEALLF